MQGEKIHEMENSDIILKVYLQTAINIFHRKKKALLLDQIRKTKLEQYD